MVDQIKKFDKLGNNFHQAGKPCFELKKIRPSRIQERQGTSSTLPVAHWHNLERCDLESKKWYRLNSRESVLGCNEPNGSVPQGAFHTFDHAAEQDR